MQRQFDNRNQYAWNVGIQVRYRPSEIRCVPRMAPIKSFTTKLKHVFHRFRHFFRFHLCFRITWRTRFTIIITLLKVTERMRSNRQVVPSYQSALKTDSEYEEFPRKKNSKWRVEVIARVMSYQCSNGFDVFFVLVGYIPSSVPTGTHWCTIVVIFPSGCPYGRWSTQRLCVPGSLPSCDGGTGDCEFHAKYTQFALSHSFECVCMCCALCDLFPVFLHSDVFRPGYSIRFYFLAVYCAHQQRTLLLQDVLLTMNNEHRKKLVHIVRSQQHSLPKISLRIRCVLSVDAFWFFYLFHPSSQNNKNEDNLDCVCCALRCTGLSLCLYVRHVFICTMDWCCDCAHLEIC